MGRLDRITDYASRLGKSREPLADEVARTSEQVADAALEIVKAPTTATVEKNTAKVKAIEKNMIEVEVVEKNTTKLNVVEKDTAKGRSAK